ncbi:MAG: M24 family metallopeptidase [Anaerolineae bacterium]
MTMDSGVGTGEITVASIVREKTSQAVGILDEMGIDLWLTFVRETSQVRDPVLDLLTGFDLTWLSALMIHRSGRRVAVVGRFDADNLRRLNAYDEVVAYDQDIRPAMVDTIAALDPRQIAVNYAEDDPASDGLTHGLFLMLSRFLESTPYASRLVSAAPVVSALRGRKTSSEISLIRAAIERTQEGIEMLAHEIRPGITDYEIADFLHRFVYDGGYGTAWERDYCPVVTVGPQSAYGHAMPTGLTAEQGHLVHIDFGISYRGFVSDLQRVWYLSGGDRVPSEVEAAWQAVTRALETGRQALRPGARGWEVDAVAREALLRAGYAEYMHAFGHQVGRTAHDGATILGPKWERYGRSVDGIVEAGNVFAIELEVVLPDRGYVSREENVLVTEDGASYLSDPQEELWVI